MSNEFIEALGLGLVVALFIAGCTTTLNGQLTEPPVAPPTYRYETPRLLLQMRCKRDGIIYPWWSTYKDSGYTIIRLNQQCQEA